MHEGRIQQIGSPRDIYECPASRFVADFVGTSNFIEGTVVRSESTPDGCVVVRTEIGDVTVRAVQAFRLDERVAVSVRPEDVELTEARPEGGNVWEGRVDQKVFLGDAIFVQLDLEKCVVLKVA